MKRLLIITFLICTFSVQATNNIVVHITTYKNGVPTQVDSLRLNARFYSNATPTVITDISYFMQPTSFIWDTVLTHNIPTDVEMLQNYEFWFGNDVLYVDGKERLRLDSVNFTSNVAIGGGGGGDGENTVIIYNIDTTTNDTLSGIDDFIHNLTGAFETSATSNSSGFATVKLDSGQWILSAGTNKTNYSFDDIPIDVLTNPDTFTILGYLNVTLPPADPSKGLIEGFVKSVLGNAKPGVIIKLALETTMNVTSTSPGGYTVGDGIAYDTTDVNGYFNFEVPRSSTYSDTLKSLYNILGTLNKIPQFVVPNINVPDTGNVDITDEINNQ